jgi:hypothetical protein
MDNIPSHEARATVSGPWDPKLQTPESRKALVDYAKQHGIKPAMRHFGCSRNTIRKWLRRFDTEGQTGLKGLPRGRKPKASKSAAPAARPTPAGPTSWAAPSNPPTHRPSAAAAPMAPAAPTKPTGAVGASSQSASSYGQPPTGGQPAPRPFPGQPRV